MITLALDTATPAPSLALLREGELVADRAPGPSRGAGRRVAHEIHLLLGDAGMPVSAIGEVVVGLGPGGFTGLRIGIATALGLGQALRVPVVGAASIEALALGLASAAPDGGLLVPVVDAKRHEVFAAAYRAESDGGLTTVVDPVATTPAGLADLLEGVATPEDPAWLAGDGLGLCQGLLGRAAVAVPAGSPAHAVHARDLVRRVEAGGARPVAPLYLRLPDAEVNRLKREREAATT